MNAHREADDAIREAGVVREIVGHTVDPDGGATGSGGDVDEP